MMKRNPVVQNLLWRAALKSFNHVPPASVDIQPILDAIQLAPSAFGVQPYDIHVITDENVKAKLKAASYNQQQLSDCSHLLVFCPHRYPTHSTQRFISSCNIDKEDSNFANYLKKSYDHQPPEVFFPFASTQAFIGLGIGLVTAADLKLGSCPMNGFVPDQVAEILQLPKITLPDGKNDFLSWPVAYLAIGSNKEDEKWHAESRKIFKRRRVPLKDLVFWHGEKTTKKNTGAVEDEK